MIEFGLKKPILYAKNKPFCSTHAWVIWDWTKQQNLEEMVAGYDLTKFGMRWGVWREVVVSS